MMIVYYKMIFNSITRELNQNEHSRRSNINPHSQPSYFPQKTYIANSIFEKMPEPTYPRQKEQSNLTKMNNRITQNIQYLRYKDQYRTSELKSSRVSHSSNRSVRSNRSNGSKSNKNSYIPSKSQLRSYLPPQKSNLQTFVPQNRPDRQSNLTNSRKYHSRQYNAPYQNQYSSDQFKYFTRNPITINTGSYLDQSKKMTAPERDINESIQRSVISNYQNYFQDFPNQTQNHQNNRTQVQKPVFSRERDWNSSFGQTAKGSKVTMTDKQKTASFQIGEHKQQVTTPINKPIQSPIANTTQRPPTIQPSKASKNGIIISAGLIALGLIILLLQIVK